MNCPIGDGVFGSAASLIAGLRCGDFSVTEVVTAHLNRIEAVNPRLNAIVTYTAESALDQAKEADQRRAKGRPIGLLSGLPIAHKDLTPTAGVRTTYGSLALKDNVPDFDSLIVERLRDAGAIMVGKSNTPEFGAGSQTFNEIFGPTRNPYDLSKTCGGSSGGAAVALASGMVPLADGSDMGGSLRNPAAFCNVVGLRPSPGRVPTWPTDVPANPLPVEGPMGRTVEDVALLLDAMAGYDVRSPVSLPKPNASYANSLERNFSNVAIALSPDFDGQLPVVSEIKQSVADSRNVFETLGCKVSDDCPSFEGADDAFGTLRAWLFAGLCGPLMTEQRELLKDTVIWNTELGMNLQGHDLARAERKMNRLYHRLREFLHRYEFLVLPVTQVMPFSVDEPYVKEINGVEMETYLDWMRSCYYITATGLPAVSVPGGFSKEGLPIGLQIVGRHRDDLGVLQLAYAFQQATEHWRRAPPP